MNERSIRLLEFDIIRKRVADRCLSEEASDLLLQESPLCDHAEILRLKVFCSQLLHLIKLDTEEPRESLPSIRTVLSKLKLEGTALELDEAFALGLFLERGQHLCSWLKNRSREAPQLSELASSFPDCSAAVHEIFKIIDKDGSLRDLNELREIRRKIKNLQKDLETITSRYLSQDDTRKMLQSDVPSLRDGRTVLAVKANFKGRIKGIVHEVSSTGHTVFLEPEDIVEKNNDILIEQRRYDAEIARIMRELSERIRHRYSDFCSFHEGVLYLERIRARARYGKETQAVYCSEQDDSSNDSSSLVLVQARHPLLGTSAVPIDLQMDTTTRTVIITGPNTGGKTVTLKTVGLFALMNQFGLAVPAEEGTVMPIFDAVFADIGDEQSISQSLSTFSGHMKNIASIAREAGRSALVLLDELGSGTDPEEGSAIAMAILDHFISKGSRLLCTTHHGILKNYGYTREGVENASVQFDAKTLSPTYKILMGIPGESRAIDIASRNGLSPGLVAQARGYLDKERSDVSALIRGLKEKHRELDSAEALRKKEQQQLREQQRKADLKELRLRQKELELKGASVTSMQKLLNESRKTLENLVREVKEGELNREKTLKVKEFLSDLEKSVEAERDSLKKEQDQLTQDRRKKEEQDSSDGNQEAVRFYEGMEVFAGPSRRKGTLVRAGKNNSWVVSVGALRLTMKEAELEAAPQTPVRDKKVQTQYELRSGDSAQFELSLRGMRLDEALEALRRQIDAAALSGLYEFSVIHGKGEGILQRGVHEFLKNQSMVADYYFSRPEHGGFGKTVVSLKRG